MLIVILLIMLIAIIQIKEQFIDQCLNKRDGVSGCRECCSIKYPSNYNPCVQNCMNF